MRPFAIAHMNTHEAISGYKNEKADTNSVTCGYKEVSEEKNYCSQTRLMYLSVCQGRT